MLSAEVTAVNADERRNHILNELQTSRRPISGSELAERYGVSRQVIVKDLALLRAQEPAILSTNKGYLLNQPPRAKRVVTTRHTTSQIRDEMQTIVDCGGKIQNVMVLHPIYGHISVELHIASRRDVDRFVKEVTSGRARPLKELSSSGVHSHMIEADDEYILDEIEALLDKKGYLYKDK